jgi:hypothetical protein
MATSNLGRFFKERFRVASSKYDTDRHEEALTQLSELLMEQQLSPVYRLKANILLADGVDDWFLAEQYRLAAENTYDGISEVVANSATGDEEALELAGLRETLDSLADDQKRNKPSEPKITEDRDTEPSTLSTSRATESTTSPADGHAPNAEAQGSQAKLVYHLEQGGSSAKAEGQESRK